MATAKKKTVKKRPAAKGRATKAATRTKKKALAPKAKTAKRRVAKAVPRKAAGKSTAKTASAKKASTKKAPAKKTPVKKAPAKKGSARKAAPRKVAAKKPATTSRTTKTAKPATKRKSAVPASPTPKAARKPAPKPAPKSAKPAATTARKPAAKPKPSRVETPAPPRPAQTVAPVPTPAVKRDTFYITTAIAYPNGAPHIGHAYEAIATDAIARFAQLDGKDVFFLTGTDEHGLKMIQTAQSEGMTPAELATRNAARFREMDEALNVGFSRFIRTSEPAHHRSVQEIWRRMRDNGDIYSDTYSGWYSVRDEAYYQEDETAVGDDGVRRGSQGTPVEWVEENSYFFRLSAYQDRLLALYDSQPDFIGPDTRRNEVVSFVKSGLKDLSISRTTFEWGVKVPDDPAHVMYVWVDALTNYLTGVGYPDESDPAWRFWPADLHVIGKDIIRFHAVYWPAFLMSAGIPLPKRVFAHGFLFNRGEKMSKSVGNVVDPFNLAAQYGVDQMRYFFLREVSFGQDGSYNHEAIVARINADLANDLGNLAQRSLTMIAKQHESRLPAPGDFN
ncbi:MAG: methionine--tRNA ligase, partial [Xanthobacteraceae bacterium]